VDRNTDRRRAILLLGGSPDQCALIHAARALGLVSVVVDRDPAAPGLALADHAAAVSTRDVPGLIALCRALRDGGVPLAGVCVMGSDIPHVVSAVAHAFGWVGPTPETAELATHKRRMRERLRAVGVATPRFRAVRDADDARTFWDEQGCAAVVLKPVDQAGSRGVRVVADRAGLDAALADARATGTQEVLVEEYVAGPQVSTETLLTEGRSATPGFADRNYDDTRAFHPRVLENGGWMPSTLPEATRRAVCDLVERGARALGIVRGVAKGDVVVHPERGPLLIEMAARIGGGDFAACLVPLSSGVDYLPSALRIALGEEPDWSALAPRRARAVVNRYLFPPSGRLEALRGVDEVRSWPEVRKVELFVSQGELLPEITHHGARAGVFVVEAEDRAHADAVAARAYDTLAFRIDGRWRSLRPATALTSPALRPSREDGGEAPRRRTA
jgi:biotin carboxylase